MCEYFDASWKLALALLLFFSIFTLLLRVRYSGGTDHKPRVQPQWLAGLLFWGSGYVALAMVLLMLIGFVCAGSPGDLTGIVPN